IRTENTVMNRKLMIDYRLVAHGYLFASTRDRCLYLGKSLSEQPRWLEANPGRFRPLEDVEKEAAQLGAPGENKNNVEAILGELNGQTTTPDVAKDGDDENDVALVDSVAGDRSPPQEPTSVPSRATTIVENGTTEAEVLRGAKAGTSEAEGSKTEPTPRGAMGRRGSRQIKKQKMPVEIAK